MIRYQTHPGGMYVMPGTNQLQYRNPDYRWGPPGAGLSSACLECCNHDWTTEECGKLGIWLGNVCVNAFPIAICIAQAIVIRHIDSEAGEMAIYATAVTVNSIYLAASCFFCFRDDYCQQCKREYKNSSWIRVLVGFGGLFCSSLFLPALIND